MFFSQVFPPLAMVSETESAWQKQTDGIYAEFAHKNPFIPYYNLQRRICQAFFWKSWNFKTEPQIPQNSHAKSVENHFWNTQACFPQPAILRQIWQNPFLQAGKRLAIVIRSLSAFPRCNWGKCVEAAWYSGFRNCWNFLFSFQKTCFFLFFLSKILSTNERDFFNKPSWFFPQSVVHYYIIAAAHCGKHAASRCSREFQHRKDPRLWILFKKSLRV